MIYKTDFGTLVIASHGCWLPGSYATRQAAQWAFQFEDVELAALRDELGRPVTTDDLRAWRTRC